MANLIKILRVKKIVDSLIEFVRIDWETKHELKESETFLFRLFNGNTEGDYDFYKQSKSIFSRDDRSPRKIKTSLMFSKDVKGTPFVHVREATKTKGTVNSLGGGMGEFVSFGSDSINEGYRDSKRGSFEVLITSDNPLDTILVSEVIYSLLYGAYETLSNEFLTFDLSVKELIMENQLIPYPLYVKSIVLDVQYDTDIPSVIDSEYLDNILFRLVNLGGVLEVSEIIVTGEGGITTIEIDKGTLQMLAEVLPIDADDRTVTWSVENLTGVATIDSDGLLHAVENGLVLVKAVANDISTVFGSIEIILSNQI